MFTVKCCVCECVSACMWVLAFEIVVPVCVMYMYLFGHIVAVVVLMVVVRRLVVLRHVQGQVEVLASLQQTNKRTF